MTKKKGQRTSPESLVESNEATLEAAVKFLGLDRDEKWRKLTRGEPIGMSVAPGSLTPDKKQLLLEVKRLLDEEASAASGSLARDDQKTLQNRELMPPALGAVVDNRSPEPFSQESHPDDHPEPHEKWWSIIAKIESLKWLKGIVIALGVLGNIAGIASFGKQISEPPVYVEPPAYDEPQEPSDTSINKDEQLLDSLAPQGSLQQDAVNQTWVVKIAGTSQEYVLHTGSYIVIQIDGKNILGRIIMTTDNQYAFVDAHQSVIKLSELLGTNIRVIVEHN